MKAEPKIIHIHRVQEGARSLAQYIKSITAMTAAASPTNDGVFIHALLYTSERIPPNRLEENLAPYAFTSNP